MRPTPALLAGAVLLTMASCGGDEPAEPLRIAGGETGTEMWFDPADTEVEPGRYELVFDNVGAVHHELAIVDPDGTVLGATSTAGRSTARFEVDLSDPGDYEMICREPGHENAGMVGSISVG
jgi:uncharacterized cupredoxin-like copper-binding protein